MPSIQSQKRSKAHKRNSPSLGSNSGNERSNNSTTGDSQQPSGGPIDPNAKQAANYGVLLLHDPKLAQIFATSSICNVYKYNMNSSEWEKLECQGTLFVYSRRQDMGGPNNESNQHGQSQPQDPYPYGIMVLNRLSLENFSLGITPLSISSKYDFPEMDVKLEEPFIMVEATDGGMYGLWLFHEEDRPMVQGMIQWCLDAQV